MFKIEFRYDETFQKWDVFAIGAASEVEAKQGFNAVVLTARDATPSLEMNRADLQPDGSYKISVGMRRPV